jgi:hypothetical protein
MQLGCRNRRSRRKRYGEGSAGMAERDPRFFVSLAFFCGGAGERTSEGRLYQRLFAHVNRSVPISCCISSLVRCCKVPKSEG